MKVLYIPPETAELKQCSQCAKLLPRTSDYFYVQHSALDGLIGACKECIKARKDNDLSRKKRANYKREYRAKNPDIARAHTHNRRTRKMEAEGTFTPSDVAELYDLQDGRCAYCGMPLNGKYHVDHMQPLARGGSNWPDNLALACSECNTSKNDKTVAEYFETLFRRWE